MIRPAIASTPNGRLAMPIAGARAGSSTGVTGFALLLGDPATGDQPGGTETIDRQDDAADGKPLPAADPATPATMEADWLAIMLAVPVTTPTPAPAQAEPPASSTATPPVTVPLPTAAARAPSVFTGANPIDAPVAGTADAGPSRVSPQDTGSWPAVSRPLTIASGTQAMATDPAAAPDTRPGLPPASTPPTVAEPNVAPPAVMTSTPATPPAPAPATTLVAKAGMTPPPLRGAPAGTIAVDPTPPAPSYRPAPATPSLSVPVDAASPPLPVVPPLAAAQQRPSPTAAPPLAPVAIGAPAPTSASIRAPAIAPAGEIFAAAIDAANRDQPDAGDGDPTASQQAASLVTATATTGATPAVSEHGDAGLDMRREGWPAAMVDHIERLRDAADAGDTRIRLVPDALGSIDVSLSRHRDGGVGVTLAAHQPATQALLADARPQLTQLAEARGIRLTASATNSAAGGSGQGSADAQRQPPPSLRATPASAATSSHDPDPADGRVA